MPTRQAPGRRTACVPRRPSPTPNRHLAARRSLPLHYAVYPNPNPITLTLALTRARACRCTKPSTLTLTLTLTPTPNPSPNQGKSLPLHYAVYRSGPEE
eukprot:scaffold54389_cov33-Phaeocystis_antarctica.AAC.1